MMKWEDAACVQVKNHDHPSKEKMGSVLHL